MTDDNASQDNLHKKQSGFGSQPFGANKSEDLKRKGPPANSELATQERILGEYVYQNHFPFNSQLNAFCISQDSLTLFLKFLGKINTHWEVVFWNCKGTSIDDFHKQLFTEILRRQYLVSGRLQLCVVIEEVSSLDAAEQLSYYDFQKNNIGSGFKSSAVLRKPRAYEAESNIGFGNLLFVFIADDSEQLNDEILKMTVVL